MFFLFVYFSSIPIPFLKQHFIYSEDEGPSKGGKKKPIQKPKQKGRTKECPGCSAHLSTATKECTYCDYQFSSKSMLITQSMMVEESDMIRDKFPFEPEREEDGSLIIQNILGRRQRKSGLISYLFLPHLLSLISYLFFRSALGANWFRSIMR